MNLLNFPGLLGCAFPILFIQAPFRAPERLKQNQGIDYSSLKFHKVSINDFFQSSDIAQNPLMEILRKSDTFLFESEQVRGPEGEL